MYSNIKNYSFIHYAVWISTIILTAVDLPETTYCRLNTGSSTEASRLMRISVPVFFNSAAAWCNLTPWPKLQMKLRWDLAQAVNWAAVVRALHGCPTPWTCRRDRAQAVQLVFVLASSCCSSSSTRHSDKFGASTLSQVRPAFHSLPYVSIKNTSACAYPMWVCCRSILSYILTMYWRRPPCVLFEPDLS